MLKLGSLFSGVGGLELGIERSGRAQSVWQAERDAWCRGILAKHWPETRRFDDVAAVTREAVEPVDVLCGGFPCQPVSQAGLGLAQDDPRWLWPEFLRIIRELQPGIVVIENVPGLRTRGLRGVLADLAQLGLDACWTTLGACDVGAPHRRNRLFVIAADPDRLDVRNVSERIEARRLDVQGSWQAEFRHDGEEGLATDAGPAHAHGYGYGREQQPAERLHADGAFGDDASRRYGPAIARWRAAVGRDAPEPCLRRVDDGLSGGVDDFAERLGALGNAVVPKCSELIGSAILDVLTNEVHR